MRWLALAVALAAGSALAQGFPSKPIRMVVAFPPGGSTDLAARALGEKLATALGQPVIVDNKPGASGNIGAEFVAKIKEDACLNPVAKGHQHGGEGQRDAGEND